MHCSHADEMYSEILAARMRELKETQEALNHLRQVTAQAAEMEDGKDKAFYYRKQVIPAMEALRKPVDALEMIVDKDIWPMPSYGDLLFEV